MKYPIFVLPNVENCADIQMLDADGMLLTATEFSKAIGGIKTLRLMVSDKSIKLQEPQITSQITMGNDEVFCFAYPAGKDSDNRITTGAIVFREIDIKVLNSDSRLQALALKAGINSSVLQSIRSKYVWHKMQDLNPLKKKY